LKGHYALCFKTRASLGAVVGEIQRKRTLAASRGFLAAARLSCFILTARISVGFERNRFISGESVKSLPIHMLNVYFDFATFNAVALMNGIRQRH